ncbi:hybrid sensor histidine kinase/response regulator transcription factor [Negadavirga shengliensis]|uniref:histidine kinase n=1 Tax=Negadavirga shengliensis TaxID=1389218 RepID=A0ABV9T2P2_9BACT
MHYKLVCLFVFAFLFSVDPAAGQESGSMLFKKLEGDKALSNGDVQAIFKDQDGLMWFGTANGLNRYDGTSMRTFLSDDADSSALSQNSIFRIYEGPEGNLWLKNFNRIFNVYLKEEEIFERSLGRMAQKYQLKSEQVKMVFKDSKGRYWFVHPFEGMTLYDPSNKKATYFAQNSSIQGSLSYNHVSYIDEAPDGDFWVVYQNGAVDVLDSENLTAVKSYKADKFLDPALSYQLEIFMDEDGDAWIFCPDYALGLAHISTSTSSIRYINDTSSVFRLNNPLIQSIMEYPKGKIWVGTDHGGINLIDKHNQSVSYILHQPEEPRSISHNAVYALYRDEQDVIWIGTHKKGIHLYHSSISRFDLVRRDMQQTSPLPFNDVNAFEEDQNGYLYIGSNGGGLWKYDPVNKTSHDVFPVTGPGLQPGEVIVDMKMDRDGMLWIGTYQNGLYAYDGDSFKHFTADLLKPGSLRDNNIWKIFEDSKGRLWVGTLREGLHLYDRTTEKFIHFPADGEEFPLSNKYVTALLEDEKGNIWVGGNNGIDVFNIDNGFHKFFSGKSDDVSGLSIKYVTELAKDHEGIIWVTTSKGLAYYDRRKDRFVSFNKAKGLPNEYLISVLAEKNGNLWISSQGGLIHANVDRTGDVFELEFGHFDEGDGLQSAYFNKNAAFASKKGNFYFGGSNGFNVLDPEAFNFNTSEPKVVFTEFQLFNQPVAVHEEINGRSLLSSSLNQAEKIQLRHHENIFSVSFSALNYFNPAKSRFLYKLEGFNEEWIMLQTPPFKVTYTNLDPGNYRLVVKATNIDGILGNDEYSLRIEIKAPFWKTPLAYVGYFILFFILFILAWRWFVARERERLKRQDELKESRRLAELDKMKTRFFTNVSHEFRTPLTLILAPVEKLLQDRPDSPEVFQYQTIQKNAKRLLLLINQLLDIKNIEKEGLKLSPSEGDIIAFVEENVKSFQGISQKKNIDLSFSSNVRSISTTFDPDKLEKIVFNFLSNAFKFTPDGGSIHVELEFSQRGNAEGMLAIRFEDNGIGIDDKHIDKIFDRYFTMESENNQGTGIGLSLAMEFTKLHKGTIEVKSKKGEGSVFEVRLPLKVDENILVWEKYAVDNGKESLFSLGDSPENTVKPSILIVEDNEELRQYLSEVLRREYNVLQASHGKEGLEIALHYIPDLVISDLLMPHMDGATLCKQIKTNIKTSHIPVILLTAKTSEEDQLQGIDSGCNLYMHKPFNLEILASSIHNLLSERERLQKHYRKKITVDTSEEELESLDDRLIQNAVAIVEKEIDNPEFSVEQLSRELGMSRVHLYKKISSLTGNGPLEFIRMIRLQRAAQLLEKHQFTVSEIAYKVGYNNAKYFSRHFKATYGSLPSQYVKDKNTA